MKLYSKASKPAEVKKNKSSRVIPVWDIAVLGMMVAALEVGKLALAAIPNVEIVTLLIVLLTLHFGAKTIYAVVVFVLLECFIWGLGPWTVMYLYIWPLLAIAVHLLRKFDSIWFWAIVAGIHGVAFGALCSLVYLFLGGPATAFAWWISGIPWDLIHGAANFIIMLVLYRPLNRVFAMAKRLRPDRK